MSTQFRLVGIAQSVAFGLGGNRVATNPLAPSGQRIEMRENDDVTPSRTSGAPAIEPDDYITLAQFQAQSKWIDPVRVLADTNQALSGVPASIDGINTLVDGDRIALINQTAPAENGVWIIRAGAWERPADFDTNDSASNRTFFVEEGSTYEDTAWTVTTDPPNDVIDTDPLTLTQIAGPGAVTTLQNIGAGIGLIPGPGVQGPGLVNVSAIAGGLGVAVAGGLGAGPLTVTAEIVNGGAGQALVSGNAAGGSTTIASLTSDDGTITIAPSGLLAGAVSLQANAAALPLYNATIFVDPDGSGSVTGRNPGEPTSYENAITQANATGNVLIVLADGTYADGDGPLSGTTTITGDNVHFASRSQDGKISANSSVIVSDAFATQGVGFTASGITFNGAITASGHGDVEYVDCALTGGITIDALDASSYSFVSTSALSLATSGAATGGEIRINGGQTFGQIDFGHSGTAGMLVEVNALGEMGPVVFGQTSTGTVTYDANDIPTHGEITDIASTDNDVRINNVEVGAVSLTDGGGSLNVINCIVGSALGSPAAINAGAGYADVVVANTFYDQQNSTIVNPVAPNSDASADQFSPEFLNSLKVQTTAYNGLSEPQVLVNSADNNFLVQSFPFSSFFTTYLRTIYVDPNGLPAPFSDGLNPARPTTYADAITAANATANTLIVLAAGTYSDGDGAASGTTTITQDGIAIVSRDGPDSVVITDQITVNGSNEFTLQGVTLGFVGIGASFTATAFVGRLRFDQVVQNGGSFVLDSPGVGGSARITDCELVDLTLSGTSGTAVVMEGGVISAGLPTGGLVTSFASEVPLSGTFIGLDLIQAVNLGHSGSGTYSLTIDSVARVGPTADGASARTALTMQDVPTLESFNFGNSAVGSGGRVYMRAVSCKSAINNLVQPLIVSSSYSNGTFLHNVQFDRETSNFNGTEVVGTDFATADENGADFSVAKIQAQQNDAAPRVLATDPNKGNLVEWIDAGTFQGSLTAGPGINATALAGNTVQTQDPVDGGAGAVVGVKKILWATFAGQGASTTVSLGTLPANARVVRSDILISATTNTTGQIDLGFGSGTGTELQDGATDNDPTTTDTYSVQDLITNGVGSTSVDLTFGAGLDGTASGEAFVEFFVPG